MLSVLFAVSLMLSVENKPLNLSVIVVFDIILNVIYAEYG
jgi:hypothetical protein